MVDTHVQHFRALRPHILTRLVDARGHIDHAYARVDPEVIRGQFSLVLDKMESFLTAEDPRPLRGFASRLMEMRIGEGLSQDNLVHTVVSIADVAAQVARERMPSSPDRIDFVRALSRLSVLMARVLVGMLAEELERRRSQLKGLGGAA